MDIENRLLLYTVVLGSLIGLGQLLHRRSFTFWIYMLELGALLAVSAAGVVVPGATNLLAWPVFWAYLTIAMGPPVLLTWARSLAGSRRYRLAALASSSGAALLGSPKPLRREALLYAAMAAAERGDEEGCRMRLVRVAATVGIPAELGGDTLIRVLPATAKRRWREVLEALAGTESRPPALLALEARAAAETGDLKRAIRAASEIERHGGFGRPALVSARRWVLASAGRTAFLEEAASKRMPLMKGPRGTAELAVARAYEAAGNAPRAAEFYSAAQRIGRGGHVLDATAGRERCGAGTLIVTRPDALDEASLLDLESACRAERVEPGEKPLLQRAPFIVTITVLTVAVSVLVFAFLGIDAISLLATGALSAPLIREEGQWWRLGTTMLLHAGVFHLAMNVAANLLVGIALEARLGAARTAIVYVGSGLLASVASAHLMGTDMGVGASGASMGLIGALLVTVFRRPREFAEAERKRWFAALGITILATVVVGIAESDAVDNAAHGAGLLAGVIFGFLLLPRSDEERLRAVAHRITAVALCGFLVACTVAAAAQMGSWRGERVVRTEGAQASLPAWIRVTPSPGAGIVGRRAPLVFAVQLAAAPILPNPRLLLSEEDAKLLAAGAMTGEANGGLALPPGGDPNVAGGGIRTGPRDFKNASGEGFRLFTFREGDAFALVVVELGPGWIPEDDEEALRIGRSLRSVE